MPTNALLSRQNRNDTLRKLVTLATALLACLAGAASANSSEIAGLWKGAIEVPGSELEVSVVLSRSSDSEEETDVWSGSIDIPAQGMAGYPLSKIVVKGRSAEFVLADIPGSPTFRGELSADGEEFQGTFSQGAANLPFRLKRAPGDPLFPTAEPASVGIPNAALDLLDARVESMLVGEDFVGGELLVIKDDRTIFRKAYGHHDRESDLALEVDALYCVRSMTKPFVGTAIQILIDEGKLTLETRVGSILPSFRKGAARSITVEHLLTHTAGFPFTTLTKQLVSYDGIAEVASEAAATSLEFSPGERFQYSDAGSDSLGAIVAAVTGQSPDAFIEERILSPLGMKDSVTLLGEQPNSSKRVPSAYSGGIGAWEKHWQSSDTPIFPFFLTSQSLYSTTTDYARFLRLWMNDGEVGGERLLSAAAVQRGLGPANLMDSYPPSFDGLRAFYGQQWQVFVSGPDDLSAAVERGDVRDAAVFGHSGSDGTYAWAWPEEDLMVLFFTQSRGATSGVALEGLLETLLVKKALDDPSVANLISDSTGVEEAVGLYWDETNESNYYVITSRRGGLLLERPSRMSEVFQTTSEPDRYNHPASAEVWVEFLRDDEGQIESMKTSFNGNVEINPRHEEPAGDVPDPLPSAAQVVAKVAEAHGMATLEESGTVRLEGSLTVKKRNVKGTVLVHFDRDRLRIETQVGEGRETVTVNGARASSFATGQGSKELTGTRLEEAQLSRFPVTFGDWTRHYDKITVLRRLKAGGRSLVLVRVETALSSGSTMFVDEESGRLVMVDSLENLPGVGTVGVRTRYQDFREVDAMHLPFKAVSEYAHPLIGVIESSFSKASTQVDVPPSFFEVGGNQP